MEQAHKHTFLRALVGSEVLSLFSQSYSSPHLSSETGAKSGFLDKTPYSFSSFPCCQAAAWGMPRSRAQKGSLPGAHVPQLLPNLCAEPWAEVLCSHHDSNTMKDAADISLRQETCKELETDSPERSKTTRYITISKCAWQVEFIYHIVKEAVWWVIHFILKYINHWLGEELDSVGK